MFDLEGCVCVFWRCVFSGGVCVFWRCVCIFWRCVCILWRYVCVLWRYVCVLWRCVCVLEVCVCSGGVCVCSGGVCVCVQVGYCLKMEAEQLFDWHVIKTFHIFMFHVTACLPSSILAQLWDSDVFMREEPPHSYWLWWPKSACYVYRRYINTCVNIYR